jgi:hypothetical protein
MNDAAYYAHREQAERVLADQAADTAVRDIHLQMAAKYADLLQLNLALAHNDGLRLRSAKG